MTDLEFQGHYERFSGDRKRWVWGLDLDTYGKRPMSVGVLVVTYMNRKKGHEEISCS